MELKWIWLWGTSSGDLRIIKNYFITITPMSSRFRVGCTYKGLSYESKRYFKDYLYFIGHLEKHLLRNINTKMKILTYKTIP